MEWYYILAIVAAIIGSIGVAIIVLIKYMSKHYWHTSPTSKLIENVYAIKDKYVNCFIYQKDSTTIMIDLATSVKAVKKGLDQLNMNPETISRIFLTHSDMDHVGAIPLFPKSEIYLGIGAKIKNPDRHKFLNDNDIIEIGSIKVQAISTPGHRMGHTVYLIDEKYLFTGDTIVIVDQIVKSFLKLISSNYEEQLESIKKIAKLQNIEGLFTAHGGYTTNFEEAIKEWK